MRKADRLFQLVNLIRAHQPVTAARLAERLEVSVRTVYRYIDDLSQSGIPVYGEAGVGYALDRDYALPPLNLTRDELEALTLSVAMLSRSTGHSLSMAARSLQAKLEAALPQEIKAMGASPIRSLAPPLTERQKADWDRLREAIQTRQALRMVYRSKSGEDSERDVLPLGLFDWGGVWTLGAWCALRKDYRNFRFDLIQRISLSDRAELADLSISFDAYVEAQRGRRVGA
ncbi:YafY family protein [Chromobacterium sp. IIBBL 290-4]|uniref:helix-turn-helix transcriptional regulator n=1 Tax=Chromobacterium sp. IIBBL 290-4 TaxID=2953890 RepID=UPI0020B8EB43|nr:YafY family protein [Chromobacterium sp. IIBBL 290-4]UTH73025.1 YafY family transcriptional regulator [Chromobacterium sp. IIBBL 290-4]